MITTITFFNPENKRQKIVKWSVIALVNLIGICFLIACLGNLIVCEKASNDPIIVEATISVSSESSFLTGVTYYTECLSYKIGNTVYDGIFYSHGRGYSRLSKHGDVITVVVNPDNPEQLIEHMYDEGLYLSTVLILSVGLTLLLYGVLVEMDSFRKWRIRREKAKFFPRSNPDYLRDVFVVELVVFAVIGIIMSLIFPNTLGFTHFIESF